MRPRDPITWPQAHEARDRSDVQCDGADATHGQRIRSGAEHHGGQGALADASTGALTGRVTALTQLAPNRLNPSVS